MADQQKIDRGYLNGIVKGRKPGSDDVRGKIASYFKINYDEMLLLGRNLSASANTEQPILQQNEDDTGDAKRTKDDEIYDEIQKYEVISSQDQLRLASSDFNISDLIKKTADILESDTTHRDALAQMVTTLHESLSKEKENLEQQNQMKEMEKRIENLENLSS